MEPLEAILITIAVVGNAAGLSAATANLVETIQEGRTAQETQVVYTFGDTDALIDGATYG